MNAPEQPDTPAAGAPRQILNLESVKSAIEMLSKIILGMAAVCFVCGIIVVNLYLREFGVASFSLFRVSYITAGVWTFSPIGFAMLLLGTFLASYFSDDLTDKARPHLAETRRPFLPGGRWQKILAAISLAVVVFAAVFSGFGIPMTWRWLLAIIIGVALGSLVIAMPLAFLESKTVGEKVLNASVTFFCLVAFLCYLLFLAPSLYKEIPASVGGGAGMPVVLVISADKQELVKAAGITFAEPLRTDQVTLLLQTDKEYVVLAGDPKAAITLSADLVSAIRHASLPK